MGAKLSVAVPASKEEAAPALSAALIDIYRPCALLFVFVSFGRYAIASCRQSFNPAHMQQTFECASDNAVQSVQQSKLFLQVLNRRYPADFYELHCPAQFGPDLMIRRLAPSGLLLRAEGLMLRAKHRHL